MRAHFEFDRSAWLVILCLMLTLSSVTLLARRSPAQAAASTAPAQVTPAGATTFSGTPDIDDGDGDELLEHWDDPQFTREERLQIKGVLALLSVIGIVSYRRRRTLRRFYGNG